MAIFTFAILTMVGLIPSGLKAYQTASNSTTMSTITQNVTTDVELMTNITYSSTIYFYFDMQGASNAAGAPSQLYTAQVNFSSLGTSGSFKRFQPGSRPAQWYGRFKGGRHSNE